MDLPPYMTPHRVTVKKMIGDSAVGPKYGPPIDDLRCLVRNKRQMTTDSNGTKAMSTGVAVFPLDPIGDIPVGSLITYNGEERKAIRSDRNELSALTPNHIEVRLQ